MGFSPFGCEGKTGRKEVQNTSGIIGFCIACLNCLPLQWLDSLFFGNNFDLKEWALAHSDVSAKQLDRKSRVDQE